MRKKATKEHQIAFRVSAQDLVEIDAVCELLDLKVTEYVSFIHKTALFTLILRRAGDELPAGKTWELLWEAFTITHIDKPFFKRIDPTAIWDLVPISPEIASAPKAKMIRVCLSPKEETSIRELAQRYNLTVTDFILGLHRMCVKDFDFASWKPNRILLAYGPGSGFGTTGHYSAEDFGFIKDPKGETF